MNSIDAYVVQVRGTLSAGAAGRMQRKSEEHQSVNLWQRGSSLRLRGHSSPEGASASDERQLRCESRSFRDGRTHCSVTQGGSIGAPAALFHIGELVTERGDVPLGKSGGDSLQRRMLHSGAGSVREHQ